MTKLTLDKQKEMLEQAKKDNKRGKKPTIQQRWYEEGKMIDRYVSVATKNKKKHKAVTMTREEFKEKILSRL